MLNAPKDLASKNILPTTAYMFVEAMCKNKMTKMLLEINSKIKKSNTFITVLKSESEWNIF